MIGSNTNPGGFHIKGMGGIFGYIFFRIYGAYGFQIWTLIYTSGGFKHVDLPT